MTDSLAGPGGGPRRAVPELSLKLRRPGSRRRALPPALTESRLRARRRPAAAEAATLSPTVGPGPGPGVGDSEAESRRPMFKLPQISDSLNISPRAPALRPAGGSVPLGRTRGHGRRFIYPRRVRE